ncbi:hypothetical protein ACFLXG_04000 [Chloroflexota bacterium]
MKTTWKPITAGILDIVVGVFNIVAMFVVIMLIAAIGGGLLALGRMAELIPIWISSITQGVVVIIAMTLGVVGVLPLLGGIYAIQRKDWRLSLLGSIIAILTVAPFGITSTILLSLSKDEFD